MVTTSKAYLFILEWMKELNLTDEDLGDRMKKSRTTVWRWRSKQSRLNPQKIADIARALGLHPEDLWRHPKRPSLDAIVKNSPDGLVKKAADILTIMAKEDA